MRRTVFYLMVILNLSALWGSNGSCDLLLQFNMKGGTILRGVVPIRFHYELTGYPSQVQRDSLFTTGGMRPGERYYDITGDVAPLERNGIRVSYRQLTTPDGQLPDPGVITLVKQVHLLAHDQQVFLLATQDDLLRLPRSRIDKIIFLGPATNVPPVTATIALVSSADLSTLLQGTAQMTTVGVLHPRYVFWTNPAVSDTLIANLFGRDSAESPDWLSPYSASLYKDPENRLYTFTANELLALLPHADAQETAFLQYYYGDPNTVPESRRDHPMQLSVRPGAQEPPALDPDHSNTLIAFVEQRIGTEKLPVVPGITAVQFQTTLESFRHAVDRQLRGCHFERVPADSLFAPVKLMLNTRLVRIDAMLTLLRNHSDALGNPLTSDELREFAALGFTPGSGTDTLRAAITAFLLDVPVADGLSAIPPTIYPQLLQRHHIFALSAPGE